MKANKHEIKGYIYVTSEEEIQYYADGTQEVKLNEVLINKRDNIVGQVSHIGSSFNFKGTLQFPKDNDLHNNRHCTFDCRRVILCNNPDLPIQQLTTEEVEYLKSVDSFEVEKKEYPYMVGIGESYKILIPKETEQPKESIEEKETLEEVAKKFAREVSEREIFKGIELHKRINLKQGCQLGYIAGFKACEEQNKGLYSEESECVNMYLDDLNIPRKSEDYKEYSIVGRIKQLEKRYLKQMSDVESHYLSKQERLYSEEEVMEMFHKLSMHLPLHYEMLVREMFKKK